MNYKIRLYLGGESNQERIGGALPATPRHMSRLLRLLPSRSDRVHKVSLRGDRKVTIEKTLTKIDVCR